MTPLPWLEDDYPLESLTMIDSRGGRRLKHLQYKRYPYSAQTQGERGVV